LLAEYILAVSLQRTLDYRFVIFPVTQETILPDNKHM